MRNYQITVSVFNSLMLLVAIAKTGFAQDDPAVKPKLLLDKTDLVAEDQAGFKPKLVAGANFMLGQNKNVPGNPDGLSLNFGYMVDSALDYASASKAHEWANVLILQLGYTRTPVVDALLKSTDTIDFKSAYLYHFPFATWFGPFVSLRLTTSMLPGYDVRPEDTNVLKLGPETVQTVDELGNPILPPATAATLVRSGDKIDLTGAFAPLTLRESVGVFAMPFDQEQIKLDIRLGFGAWEIFVRDGYVVEDNDATAAYLELRQMQDSFQMGPELALTATGALKNNVTYTFNALFMQPVYHTADTDLEGTELLNAEFEFLLGVKLWEWASLDYTFKALKQPLVVDDWQIQNGLLLSLKVNLVN